MGDGAMVPTGASDLVKEYNIPVAFSDLTGTINFCHLQPAVAEALLACKVAHSLHRTLTA
jgi:hypothetical protein